RNDCDRQGRRGRAGQQGLHRERRDRRGARQSDRGQGRASRGLRRSSRSGALMKRRVAILISGRGSNMAALIEAAKASDFPAEIAVVICNRAQAGGLERARASGVATEIIESKPFGSDRAAFEKVLEEKLAQHRIELICLGGFMRLFTAAFVQRWYGRMLNI